MKLCVALLTILAAGVGLTGGVRKSRRKSRDSHRRRETSGCTSDGDGNHRRRSGDKCTEGWGAGTRGGRDGKIYTVEDLNDFGSCDLRAALESDEKLYIVFDKSGTIQLDEMIKIEGYKTIDGLEEQGKGNVIIKAPPATKDKDIDDNKCLHGTAMQMKEGKELIINHITFDGDLDSDDWDTDAECADAIFIQSSENIWIHHNKFTRWQDSAIEVRVADGGGLNNYITITDNVIEEVYQAFVFSAEYLSFGKNYCKKTRKRCIKVYDGSAHSYNNLIENWGDRAIQNAVKGKLYSQSNVFRWDRRRGSAYNKVNKIESSSGGIYNKDNMDDGVSIEYCDENNSCKSSGNDGPVGVKVSSSFRGDSEDEADFICTGSSSSCKADIITEVQQNAGPR